MAHSCHRSFIVQAISNRVCIILHTMYMISYVVIYYILDIIKIIEIWPMTAMGHFNYNSLSQSLKYELWQLWAISFTIPYQNHWNMTYGSYGQFQLQFLIKIIEMWPMTVRATSFTIPYQNHGNMIDDW